MIRESVARMKRNVGCLFRKEVLRMPKNVKTIRRVTIRLNRDLLYRFRMVCRMDDRSPNQKIRFMTASTWPDFEKRIEKIETEAHNGG